MGAVPAGAEEKLNRSAATLDDYQSKIDCHLSDWLDQPLVEITPEMCNKRHTKIGENHGTYMANGTMRVLRAIWRRTRRQHRELPETPTANVDFYPEHGRTAVITDWPAWWERHPADRQSGAARLLHLAGVLRMPGRGDHDAWR